MTKTFPLYQLDAFAEAPFAGNPAAVVPLDAWLPDQVMQAVAAENNLSETAFVVPMPDGAESDYHLRWFTPTVEVDLCGHATLATGAVLFGEMGFAGERVRFHSRGGPLFVARGEAGRLALDFPVAPARPITMPAGLAEMLGGVDVLSFHKAYMNMAVLADEAAVRAVTPNLKAIAALPGDGLVVTAPGAGRDGAGGDVASRYFAPHAGIDEDPVTGSAHCMIAPYWSERLGRTRLHCRQVSARGGDLHCTVSGDRVRIEGHVRPYLEGRITI
ncbi:PhzF family phenazine biosynthesis protein [Marivibrio halodurans]|uniref:PhzF family phenazine biosynthesis protein n=1 Tax=Marivibrio halodurans TaxID=2039722 RepID=A0A8J7SNI3_9PROT|nr:PhzF family phenazine biosynthesis protein [Marivibrio halodurans]MBP5857676.1 PhzF family phenazine biosynthesis protein [Marivibrio halodurans]